MLGQCAEIGLALLDRHVRQIQIVEGLLDCELKECLRLTGLDEHMTALTSVPVTFRRENLLPGLACPDRAAFVTVTVIGNSTTAGVR